MKHLLLTVLTSCAVLLPVQQASAQKKFGDLAPKTKFKMVVTKVTATVNDGKGNKPTKVPATMPQFKVKDKIEFTIGSQGQLNGKLKTESFSLPFQSGNPGLNTYVSYKVGQVTTSYTGSLAKSAKKKPTTLELYFNRTELKIDLGGGGGFPGIGGGIPGIGSSMKTYSVIYELRAAK